MQKNSETRNVQVNALTFSLSRFYVKDELITLNLHNIKWIV